jgi:hypothetical protein
LAARPVGANNTDFNLTCGSTLTKALINVVFPVPAYPLRTKQESTLLERTNFCNNKKTSLCCEVGLFPKFCSIRSWKFIAANCKFLGLYLLKEMNGLQLIEQQTERIYKI